MTKEIIKYQKSKHNYIRVGKNSYVSIPYTDSRPKIISTSTVLNYDEVEGTFETRHIIYMLEEDE